MPLSPPPPTPPTLPVNDAGLIPVLIKTSPTADPVTPPDSASSSDSEGHRARSRSRSPTIVRRRKSTTQPILAFQARQQQQQQQSQVQNDTLTTTINKENGDEFAHSETNSNGLLTPPVASKFSFGSSWRSISRSPSPMGLIPIHETFRQFIHRHEVPRKVLHVSIGFIVLHLYRNGIQTTAVTPILGYALIPIASADILRFVSPSFNWFYIRVLGALMRETEYSGWNGVIWYLVGTWTVLTVFPKDIGVVSVLLLSWCDTAASTFGRLWGRYTPRIRKGKSLAGSVAAMLVGALTAYAFYGFIEPATPSFADDPVNPLSFHGRLGIQGRGEVSGKWALGIMSIVTGMIGAASEMVDVWGLDDNVVIPIVSAVGMWGFLKVFGLE